MEGVVVYKQSIILTKDNITSILEGEVYRSFDMDRAKTIHMFMSKLEVEGHKFTKYQDGLWKQMVMTIVERERIV